MKIFRKSLLLSGGAALLLTSGTPAIAAQSAKDIASAETGVGIEQAYDGHRRRWRHRDRVDAGDILAGIGILAGIAIIAGAASDASKNDRSDRDDRPYDERDIDQPEPDYAGGDLGSAVSACTAAAEQAAGNDERVNEIRSVTRDGAGWRVEGELASNGFTCAATDGRVDYIRLEERDI